MYPCYLSTYFWPFSSCISLYLAAFTSLNISKKEISYTPLLVLSCRLFTRHYCMKNKLLTMCSLLCLYKYSNYYYFYYLELIKGLKMLLSIFPVTKTELTFFQWVNAVIFQHLGSSRYIFFLGFQQVFPQISANNFSLQWNSL